MMRREVARDFWRPDDQETEGQKLWWKVILVKDAKLHAHRSDHLDSFKLQILFVKE